MTEKLRQTRLKQWRDGVYSNRRTYRGGSRRQSKEVLLVSRYADAYPYPTDHEPKPELTREDDEFWDALVEEPLPEDNPTRPWVSVDFIASGDATQAFQAGIDEAHAQANRSGPIRLPHRHDLCGHECTSGACGRGEGICLDCEFKLQDSREPHNS